MPDALDASAPVASRGRAEHRRRSLVRRLLLCADALALLVALTATEVLAAGDHRWPALVALLIVGLPLWLALADAAGLYSRDVERVEHSVFDDLLPIAGAVTVAVWLVFASTTLAAAHPADPAELVLFWVLGITAVVAARSAAQAAMPRFGPFAQNTIILGAGDVGQRVAATLRRSARSVRLLGFVDGSPLATGPIAGLDVLGGPDELERIVRERRVHRVVVAFSQERHHDTLRVLRALHELDVQVDIVPRLFDVLGPRMRLHSVQALPLIGLPPLKLSRSALAAKRIMDLLLSGVGVVVLSPVLLGVAVAVRLDSPGPILYRPQRVGRDGSRFAAVKFRTMHSEYCRGAGYGGTSADEAFGLLMLDRELREEFARTHKLRDDPRVTRVGRVLRRFSLDELPQLWNVLVGELSLVGPRPVAIDEYENYGLTSEPRRGDARLGGYWEVTGLRPGLTGWWQINGRSALDYDERLRLDLAYATHWSLRLDVSILAKTLRALRTGAGAA